MVFRHFVQLVAVVMAVQWGSGAYVMGFMRQRDAIDNRPHPGYDSYTDQLLDRRARNVNPLLTTATPRQYCGQWTPWLNSSHPADHGNSEFEKFTAQEIENLCPSTEGGLASDLRCKDVKGEPYHDKVNVSMVSGMYVLTCNDVRGGLSCYPGNKANDSCPDFAIRFKCDCDQYSPSTTRMTTPSTSAATLVPGQSLTIGPQARDGDPVVKEAKLHLGSLEVSWWIVMLIICLVLFLANVVIAVCLYKRNKARLLERHASSRKIHPLQDI